MKLFKIIFFVALCFITISSCVREIEQPKKNINNQARVNNVIKGNNAKNVVNNANSTNTNAYNKTGAYFVDVINALNLEHEKQKKFKKIYMNYGKTLKELREKGVSITSNEYKSQLQARKEAYLSIFSEIEYQHLQYFNKGYYDQTTSYIAHPANLKKSLQLTDDQFNKLARIESEYMVNAKKIDRNAKNYTDVSRKLRKDKKSKLTRILNKQQNTKLNSIYAKLSSKNG